MNEAEHLASLLVLPSDVPLPEAASKPRASTPEEEVTRLYDELRTPVLRFLSSLGIAPSDGDEVVQEVFLALFQHLRRGRPRWSLRGWVFRVAHNLALKQRDRSRMAHSSWNEQEAAHPIDARPTPEQHAADLQRRQRLLAVVRALPESDRCCLYLRAEGLRYREIADVLGISLGAVCLSLQRSIARLSRADGH